MTHNTKYPKTTSKLLLHQEQIIGTTPTTISCTTMLLTCFLKHQNNIFLSHSKQNVTVRFCLIKQEAYCILMNRTGLNAHLNTVASRSHSSDPSLLKMILVTGLCKKFKTVMRCITKYPGDNRIFVSNTVLMARIGIKCEFSDLNLVINPLK